MSNVKISPLDQDLVREFIDYNPETGVMKWKARNESHFKSKANAAQWNTRYAGKLIGSEHWKGYLTCRINYKAYRIHRVAWCHANGDTEMHIDHINGIKTDNRLINLRLVDNQENHRNMRMRADNSSGVTGVYWNKRYSYWVVQIAMPCGKKRSLGCFRCLDEAKRYRAFAQKVCGYTDDHGDVLDMKT
jgi:hypothetical protein